MIAIPLRLLARDKLMNMYTKQKCFIQSLIEGDNKICKEQFLVVMSFILGATVAIYNGFQNQLAKPQM